MKKNKISKQNFLNLLFDKIFLFVIAIAMLALIAIGADVIMKSGQLTVEDNLTVNTKLTVYGKVGIGTTSPGAKLDVKGNVLISSPNSGIFSLGFKRTDEAGRVHDWRFWHMNQAYRKNSLEFWEYKTDSTGTSCGGNAADGAMCTPRLVIKEGGNVGIGTTTPGAKLDVVGTVRATEFCINDDCLDTWPTPPETRQINWVVSEDDIYSAVDGNVGIGTTSPGSYKLEVHGGSVGITTTNEYGYTTISPGSMMLRTSINDYTTVSSGTIFLRTGNDYLKLFSNNAGGYSRIEWADDIGAAGDKLSFYFNAWCDPGSCPGQDKEVMVLAATGNVGIGTTDPKAKLDVHGTIKLHVSNSGDIQPCTAEIVGALYYNEYLPSVCYCGASFGSIDLEWRIISTGNLCIAY